MLKIYSQNLWGGQVFGPLCQQLLKYRDQVHIFCFQEVLASSEGLQPYTSIRTNLLAELLYRLPDYEPLFCNLQSNFDPDGELTSAIDFGQAIFVHRSLELTGYFRRFIFRTENAWSPEADEPLGWCLGRAIQVITIRYHQDTYVIGNVHGLWHASGKGDVPARFDQPRRIVAAMTTVSADKRMIVGDFNALPSNQSLRLIEQAGYRNLVREYGITDTRTVFYDKMPRLADYAFVSGAVEVNQFCVNAMPVSDHAALILAVI